MSLLKCSLTAVAAGLLASLGHAQDYNAAYTVNLTYGSPVYDVIAMENGNYTDPTASGTWGGASWPYAINGNGSTTLNVDFGPYDQPTNAMFIGLTDNLPGDGGTTANPMTHVVLLMDPTAASDAAGIDWGTLFRNTDENQLISEIKTATSGGDWSVVVPALNQVGAFANGDATTGILNPDGTSQSAYFTPGGAFTVEAWSTGQVIGSGTSTVTFTPAATPEPAPFMVLGAGLGVLVLLKRKR